MGGGFKFLIGLAAALLAAFIHHGPVGAGAGLIDQIEARANAKVAEAGVPGTIARLARDPLARFATLDGPANDLQREGLGSQYGISDYVREAEGVAGVAWGDEGTRGFVLPLLAEIMILAAAAFLIGYGAGFLLWGRRKRTSYLD